MKHIKSFSQEEYGWFLMDAVALCIVLFTMVGALGMYRMSLNMRHSALMRTSATHLAETQCSYLEEQAYSGKLPEGDVPWLGRPEDLSQDGTPLQVKTTVTPMEPPMQQVSIQVSWTVHGKEESLRLERWLREHG